MDDATIDSDDDDGDDQFLTEEELTAAIIENDLKLSSLLERKNELPLRTRNKFNALVAELLTKTKDDIHEMICDNNINDDYYRGLDSIRDTEAEVETAIRFFPEVISQTYTNEDNEEEEYPIQRLCFGNVKCVSFIAVIAQVAIKLQSFEDHERGGLLIEDNVDDNTFRNLMCNFGICPNKDDLLLTLLIRLRRMGLFKKDDIRDNHLVFCLCKIKNLPERGFRFLVEWDPTSLLQTDDGGCLPLHWAAKQTSIREFPIVFNYVIRYYPYKKGIRLLFQKDNDGDTPFQTACQQYGRDVVMEIAEEILTRYHSEGTPLHIVEALTVTAADENVHLDCSYLLLRREPDVLVRLLLSGPHNNNNNDDDGGGGGSEGSGNHNDGNEVDDADHDEDEDGDGVGSDCGDDDNDGDDDDDFGKSKNNNRAGTRKRKRGGV